MAHPIVAEILALRRVIQPCEEPNVPITILDGDALVIIKDINK